MPHINVSKNIPPAQTKVQVKVESTEVDQKLPKINLPNLKLTNFNA